MSQDEPEQYAIVGYAQAMPPTLAPDMPSLNATTVPTWRDWLPDTSFKGHWLDQMTIQTMDPLFFAISPVEACTVRPVSRLALELTWNAFENGAIVPSTLKGANIATILSCPNESFDKVGLVNQGFHAVNRHYGTGAVTSTTAGRINYFFDFKGMCLVQESLTASGATALDQAITVLKQGHSDAVIVGDFNIHLWPKRNELNIEYATVLIIKRYTNALQDGNRIFSIIDPSNPLDMSSKFNFDEQRAKKHTLHDHSAHVLTLSAKSPASLAQLAKNYVSYLQNTEASLADICYTSNVGREHFNRRIAIIATSKEQLIIRLSDSLSSGRYQGVAAKNKHDVAKNKNDAVMLLSHGDEEQLAHHFISGNNISWPHYHKRPKQLVTLPTYAFAKEHFWISEEKEYAIPKSMLQSITVSSQADDDAIVSVPHLLLGNPEPKNGLVSFRQTLGQRAMEYLRDHAIHDMFVFPAAGFVDICLSAGKRLSNDLILSQLDLVNPLVMDGRDDFTTLRTDCLKKGTEWHLKVYAQTTPEGDFTICAKAILTTRTTNTIPQWTTLSTDAKVICNDKESIYSSLATTNHLYYGPNFAHGCFIAGNDETMDVIIHVEDSSLATYPTQDFSIPPAFLDTCLHSIAAHQPSFDPEEQSEMLPIGFKNVEILDQIPQTAICRWRYNSNGKDSRLRKVTSGTVYDAKTKKAVLQIGEFIRRRTKASELGQQKIPPVAATTREPEPAQVPEPSLEQPPIVRKAHLESQVTSDRTTRDVTPKAIPYGTPPTTFQPSPTIPESRFALKWADRSENNSSQHYDSVVIYADDRGWARNLLDVVMSANLPCTFVRKGTSYDQEEWTVGGGLALLTIDPVQKDHHRRVMDRIHGSVLFVNAWSLDVRSMADIQLSTEANLAFLQSIKARSPSVVWVTQGAFGMSPSNLSTAASSRVDLKVNDVCLEQSPMVGFIRVIRRELFHKLSAYHLDLSVEMSENIADLWNDIVGFGSTGTSRTVAYRQTVRLIPQLEASDVQFDAGSGDGHRVLDGTFVVTGGLGQVPIAVCEHLASLGVEAFVLIGRRSANKTPELTFNAIYRQADVSDFQSMDTIFKEIRSLNLPPVTGIIHGAGLTADRAVTNLDWQAYEQVLKPKALGALVLHELSSTIPTLQHFVMLSGLGSIFGNIGQANYCAANSFMDALATWRDMQGLPGLAIQLPPVGGTQMAQVIDTIFDSKTKPPIRSSSMAHCVEFITSAMFDGPPVQCVGNIDLHVTKDLPEFKDDPLVEIPIKTSVNTNIWQWSTMSRSLSHDGTPLPATPLRTPSVSSRSSSRLGDRIGAITPNPMPPLDTSLRSSRSTISPRTSPERMEMLDFTAFSPRHKNSPWFSEVSKFDRGASITMDSPLSRRGSIPTESILLPPFGQGQGQDFHRYSSVGRTQVVAENPSSKVKTEVKTWFLNLLNKSLGLSETLDVEASLVDYGIDSITFNEMKAAAKDKYKVEIPSLFLSGDQTVQELLDFIVREVSEISSYNNGTVSRPIQGHLLDRKANKSSSRPWPDRTPDRGHASGPFTTRQVLNPFETSPLQKTATLPSVPLASVAKESSSPSPSPSPSTIFLNLLQNDLGVSPDALDLDEPLAAYGVDSISFTRLSEELQKSCGTDIPSAFASSDRSIRELNEWLDRQVPTAPTPAGQSAPQIPVATTAPLPAKNAPVPTAQPAIVNGNGPLSNRLSHYHTAPTSPASVNPSSKDVPSTIFLNLLQTDLGVSPDSLDLDEPLSAYGVDSISFTRLSEELQRICGRDIPTDFASSDRSIQELNEWLDRSVSATTWQKPEAAKTPTQAVPINGNVPISKTLFHSKPSHPIIVNGNRDTLSHNASSQPAFANQPKAPSRATSKDLPSTIFLNLLQKDLGVSPDDLDLEEPLSAYGVDSISFARLSEELQKICGKDIPTDFASSDRSIQELTQWLDKP